jgi:hypothetical protein
MVGMGDFVLKGAHNESTERRGQWAPLDEAATYARMPKKRLLRMIRAKQIRAHQDPEDRRGGGKWWVCLPSIDDWHEEQVGDRAVRTAVKAFEGMI